MKLGRILLLMLAAYGLIFLLAHEEVFNGLSKGIKGLIDIVSGM